MLVVLVPIKYQPIASDNDPTEIPMSPSTKSQVTVPRNQIVIPKPTEINPLLIARMTPMMKVIWSAPTRVGPKVAVRIVESSIKHPVVI